MAEKKVKARVKWIKTKEDREECQRRRRNCNKATRKRKRECIDRRIKEIENEGLNRNARAFYERIKQQNKVFKGRVRSVKMRDVRLADQEDQYRHVWSDHFMELLNDISQSGNEVIERNEGDNDEQELISPTKLRTKEITTSRN
ncbi:hypothetical protein QE152_g37440 [Popillia japonica]|uniref:BZIP domain-containing protein n=1 Tax=Popillia japonica TaxID=7064 RepID=A0AAW1IAH2_POPJA